MNRLLIIVLILPTFFCCGQNKLDGEYFNHFGDSLYIHDSTYSLYINIDQYSNNYWGTVKRIKDTIYLTKVLDLNLLRRSHSLYSNQIAKDSILNLEKKKEAKLINEYEWRFRNLYKFLVDDNNLYLINSNGKIDKRVFKIDQDDYGTNFIKSTQKPMPNNGYHK